MTMIEFIRFTVVFFQGLAYRIIAEVHVDRNWHLKVKLFMCSKPRFLLENTDRLSVYLIAILVANIFALSQK